MSLEVQHLTKVYGQQQAVADISFSVPRGQILGYLGPNGAGKSTTMKIITGYLPATSGTVQVNGLDVAEYSLEARRQTGYLPEHNPLYLDMYVPELLRYVGSLYGLRGKALTARVEEMIALTGLGPERTKKVGQLSKGYRQRVGLAQALIHNPTLLILDEPTSGLDPNQVVEIRRVIKEAGKDKTVLFSSHILSEVEQIADRVVILNRGRLMADRPIHELAEAFAAEYKIVAELDEPGFDTAPLAALPGVLEAILSADDRSLTVRTTKDQDLRRAISEEAIRQQRTIIALNRTETTLEDIFRQVTA